MIDDPIATTPNTPIGRRTVHGFATFTNGTSGPLSVDQDVYSDEDVERGRERRADRVAYGLTMGDAARATGLTVMEVSDIERGHRSVDAEEYRRRLSAVAS